MKRRYHAALAHVALAIGSAAGMNGAIAADTSARALAAGCQGCHQPRERTLPVIAGQSREALAAKLRGFRDGTRAGTIMPQLAKGYTEAQVDALAGYFAELKASQ